MNRQKPDAEPYESAVLEVFRMKNDIITASTCDCDDAYGCGDCEMFCES